MANLTYRQSIQEAPSFTTTKNASLTSQEIDGNFKSLNDELITKAPLESPGFSGVPTAPTATAGTNTTQLATTAFVQTGLSTRQPLDAELTAISGLSANGLITRTGASTAESRSIAVSGTGLSVTNADGVAGNPTVTSNATAANNVSTIVARDASGNFSAGTITAALAGNADTATKLATARTISLTGDVTGSVSFDGSANASITTTVVDDSHNHVITNVDGLQTALDGKVAKDSNTGSAALPAGTTAQRSEVPVAGALRFNSTLKQFEGYDGTAWGAVSNPDATAANTASTIVARDASGNFSAGTITAALAGNALTASELQTVRTISLTGDVTGSTSFNGSQDVTLTATIAANSVALGTDTTGNYVAGATAGNYILVSGTAGEGWSPTIAVDATSLNTASKVVARDASGNFSAGTITAALAGNALTATTLQTAHTINGTSFNGSANITTANWGTSRTLTIGNSGKAVSGSGNVTWSLTEIGAIPAAEKGVANGVATLDSSGLVPASQLPSYVDDVLEYAALASFPVTGELAKIYVALDTNKIYRWSGSAYIEISPVAGNADTATKLATARTILLTGDVTGSTSFNGSQDVTLTATIAPSSVALGTDTTGNYVASLTQGTGIAVTGTAGEGWSPTVSLATAGTAGTYTKVTTDTYGRVTSGTALLATDIPALDASKITTGILANARLAGTYSGFTHKFDGANTVFTTPSSGTTSTAGRTVYGLAEYKSTSTSQVGAIVFIAPNTSSTIMHQMEVTALLHNQSIVSTQVQGYRTTGSWSSTRKVSTGTADIQVRWGVTPDGKNCLILGDVGTSWPYPHVSITKAMFSHTGVTDAYCTGWTVAVVTNLSAYTQVTSAIADSAITGSVTGNAATATKLATARTISLTGDVTGSVSFNGDDDVILETSVGDDSHNHVIANVDGLQTALDGKVAKDSATGSAALPAGTTAQRSEAPAAGALRFNSTLAQFEGYDGTAWGAVSKPDSSIVSFQQAGTGAVVRTAQDKMREVVSVKDFGAVGNGVADDTTAIQAALTYAVANSPCKLIFPSGKYKCNSVLGSFTGSDVEIDLQGSTLDFSALALSSTGPLLQFSGSYSTGVALTASATEGAKTISAPSAGFAVGDMVRVYSNAVWDSTRTSTRVGEINFVVAIPNSSSLTLSMELKTAYTTGDLAKVQKITPVKRITLRNGVIVGPTGNDQLIGVMIEAGNTCLVENLKSYDIDKTHLRLVDCVYSKVTGCHFEESNHSSQAYGVSFQDATQDCVAIGNTFTNVRHSLSTNNAVATSWGIVRRILFASNAVTDSSPATGGAGGDAIDTHAGAEEISILGNTVNSSSGYGINFEARSGVIANNLVKNTATGGIYVHPRADTPSNISVVGNTLNAIGDSVSEYGIHVAALTADCIGCVVSNNHIESFAQPLRASVSGAYRFKQLVASSNTAWLRAGATTINGVEITSADFAAITGNTVKSGAAGIVLTDCKNSTVQGNTVEIINSSGSSGWGIRVQGTSTRIAISGNALRYSSSGITSTIGISFAPDTVTYSGVWNNVAEGFATVVGLSSGTGNTAANNL